MPLEELRPGDPRQMGAYLLAGRLGSGGMGRVFLGRSPGGRLVAVKVIHAELADSPDFRARFAREVAAAKKVSGLFTAPVVDAGVDDPVQWLATAYVRGPTLGEAVASDGPLSADSVRALAAGLAEGLGAIHAAGVVHRDLKPSNVLLAEDGARVIDFGISRAAEASALTRTGLVVGSPGFMSPEQAEGHDVGPPSDVFSLGAVLVFAAVGEGPFGTGSTAAMVYRVVHSEPHLDGVPSEIRSLVMQCLAKNPAERPATELILTELNVLRPAAADLAELRDRIMLLTTAQSAAPVPEYDDSPANDGQVGPGVWRESDDAGPRTITSVAVAHDPHRTELSASGGLIAEAPGTSAPETALASLVPGELPMLATTKGSSASAYNAPGSIGSIGSTPRRRRRAVGVSAVAAVIGIGAGLAIWAPWVMSPARSAPPVLSPVGLIADSSTNTSVTISWLPPPKGPLPGGYLIMQGSVLVGSVPGTVTTYRETGLDPDTSYNYQVIAVRGSHRSRPSSLTSVSTRIPPLTASVLTGAWTVRYKDVAWYSLNFTPKLSADYWTFTPQCATGPCSVKLVGAFQGWTFRTTLHRHGAVYKGTATNTKYLWCGSPSNVDVSYLTFQIKMRSAETVGAQWMAASWTGTMVLYTPPNVSCAAAGVTARIDGTS